MNACTTASKAEATTPWTPAADRVADQARARVMSAADPSQRLPRDEAGEAADLLRRCRRCRRPGPGTQLPVAVQPDQVGGDRPAASRRGGPGDDLDDRVGVGVGHELETGDDWRSVPGGSLADCGGSDPRARIQASRPGPGASIASAAALQSRIARRADNGRRSARRPAARPPGCARSPAADHRRRPAPARRSATTAAATPLAQRPGHPGRGGSCRPTRRRREPRLAPRRPRRRAG